jgi:23S rRNA (uracil1939-C5)-methyltransferase
VTVLFVYKLGVRPDVIVVDPPRAGCEKAGLENFAYLKPKRIVYVSCNPVSLARDIAILSEFGYVAKVDKQNRHFVLNDRE